MSAQAVVKPIDGQARSGGARWESRAHYGKFAWAGKRGGWRWERKGAFGGNAPKALEGEERGFGQIGEGARERHEGQTARRIKQCRAIGIAEAGNAWRIMQPSSAAEREAAGTRAARGRWDRRNGGSDGGRCQ
jgi:hypothetical protein